MKLNVLRTDRSACSEQLVLGNLGVSRTLPTGRVVSIDLPALTPGAYDFTCGMNMLRGRLIAEAWAPTCKSLAPAAFAELEPITCSERNPTMKKLLVLAFLSPLSACASVPWSSLDAAPASPTSLRAPEAPHPRLVAVLADADPLRAPSGIDSEARAQSSEHTGHHSGTARQGVAAGQTSEHAGHGGHTGHSGSASDAGMPASNHGHPQH